MKLCGLVCGPKIQRNDKDIRGRSVSNPLGHSVTGTVRMLQGVRILAAIFQRRNSFWLSPFFRRRKEKTKIFQIFVFPKQKNKKNKKKTKKNNKNKKKKNQKTKKPKNKKKQKQNKNKTKIFGTK
jgi:hypothetical protein